MNLAMNLVQFNELVLETTSTLVLEMADERVVSVVLDAEALLAQGCEPLPEIPVRFELVGSAPWLECEAFTSPHYPVRVSDLLQAVEAYERRTRSQALENLNPSHIYFEGVYPVRGAPGRFEIVWGS